MCGTLFHWVVPLRWQILVTCVQRWTAEPLWTIWRPTEVERTFSKLVDARKYLTKLEIWIIANSLIPFWKKVTQVHAVQQMFVCFSHLRDAWITRFEYPPTPFGSFAKIHPNLIIQASHDYSHWREIAQVCTLQQVIRKSWTFEKAFTHPFSG